MTKQAHILRTSYIELLKAKTVEIDIVAQSSIFSTTHAQTDGSFIACFPFSQTVRHTRRGLIANCTFHQLRNKCAWALTEKGCFKP
jgi:hypothetical protein